MCVIVRAREANEPVHVAVNMAAGWLVAQAIVLLCVPASNQLLKFQVFPRPGGKVETLIKF